MQICTGVASPVVLTSQNEQAQIRTEISRILCLFPIILEPFDVYRCHCKDRSEFFEAVSCTRSAIDEVFGPALGVGQRLLVLEIMQHPCQLLDPLCHSYMRNTTVVYT